MAIDVKQLTKQWIEFLKRNQIVDLNSDPKTGDLRYRKKVMSSDLDRFLRIATDLDDQVISDAIHMVMAKKLAGSRQKGLPAPAQQQNKTPEQDTPEDDEPIRPEKQDVVGEPTRRAPKPRYSKDNATDTNYRENIPRLKEAIKDIPSSEEVMDEKDVEDVFTILAGRQTYNPEPGENDKIEKLNKIKRIIRDKMTAEHRRALWRALTND